MSPTRNPSMSPTTLNPTQVPTQEPTAKPASSTTRSPSADTSKVPTALPTANGRSSVDSSSLSVASLPFLIGYCTVGIAFIGAIALVVWKKRKTHIFTAHTSSEAHTSLEDNFSLNMDLDDIYTDDSNVKESMDFFENPGISKAVLKSSTHYDKASNTTNPLYCDEEDITEKQSEISDGNYHHEGMVYLKMMLEELSLHETLAFTFSQINICSIEDLLYAVQHDPDALRAVGVTEEDIRSIGDYVREHVENFDAPSPFISEIETMPRTGSNNFTSSSTVEAEKKSEPWTNEQASQSTIQLEPERESYDCSIATSTLYHQNEAPSKNYVSTSDKVISLDNGRVAEEKAGRGGAVATSAQCVSSNGHQEEMEYLMMMLEALSLHKSLGPALFQNNIYSIEDLLYAIQETPDELQSVGITRENIEVISEYVRNHVEDVADML